MMTNQLDLKNLNGRFKIQLKELTEDELSKKQLDKEILGYVIRDTIFFPHEEITHLIGHNFALKLKNPKTLQEIWALEVGISFNSTRGSLPPSPRKGGFK